MGNWIEVAPQLNSQTGTVSLAVFNGKLYGGTKAGFNGGRLFEWNGTNAWVEVAPELNIQLEIKALAVFNNKLYGATGGSANGGGRLFEWNGTNAWVEVAPNLFGQAIVHDIAVFNNKLYGVTGSSGALAGKLLEWNGTNAWVEVAPQLNNQFDVRSIAVFNNKLYGGTQGGGRLFEWNGTNAWVEVAPSLNSSQIFSLGVFNNKLYGGTIGSLSGSGARLFEWNGTNAWVEVAPTLNNQSVITELVVFNNGSGDALYGGTGDNANLFKWNGTNAWIEVALQIITNDFKIESLAVFNNILYGGTSFGGKLFQFVEPSPTTTLAPTVIFLNLEIGNITQTTIEILTTVDIDATVYFVTLLRDSDEPTSQQVKDGTDADDNNLPAGFFGSGNALENVELSLASTNLVPETEYDIWVVAENNPLQSSPSLLQATTLGFCEINDFDGILFKPEDDCKNPSGVFRTITGSNFTVGGDPLVFVDDIPVEIVSFTDTEIVIIMPDDLGIGQHTLRVESGSP